MRIKLFILSLLFSINLFSQVTFRQVAFYLPIAALATTPLFDRFWTYEDRQTNGLYLSQGLDPKMIFDGVGLDFYERLSGHFNRIEPSIIWESFSQIDFQAIGFSLDYAIINRKVSLLTGFETLSIFNQNKSVQGYGVNAEVRYLINNRYSISYLGDIISRPELSTKKAIYNGRLNLIIKL